MTMVLTKMTEDDDDHNADKVSTKVGNDIKTDKDDNHVKKEDSMEEDDDNGLRIGRRQKAH